MTTTNFDDISSNSPVVKESVCGLFDDRVEPYHEWVT